MGKTLLHSLTHEASEQAPSDIFDKEYARSTSLKIDRDGLFFSVFNKMHDANYAIVPHLLTAQFEAFNSHEVFYCLRGMQNISVTEAKEVILLFNLNPQECSLEMLADFLVWFQAKMSKASKVIAYYHYGLDLSKSSDKVYLTQYFQTIQQYLGFVPEARSVLQLEKRASFENAIVIEAGSQWKCLDNYLVHVILSKGGCLYQQTLKGFEFEIISEEKLSPFHSLQILKRRPGYKARCVHLEELKMKNFLKHPQDMKIFYYLIYKNIF